MTREIRNEQSSIFQPSSLVPPRSSAEGGGCRYSSTYLWSDPIATPCRVRPGLWAIASQLIRSFKCIIQAGLHSSDELSPWIDMTPSFTKLLPVRIPSLSKTPFPPAPYLSLEASIERVADFLEQGITNVPEQHGGTSANGVGGTVVLTGAGISVDSGIRAYRGKHGSYTV